MGVHALQDVVEEEHDLALDRDRLSESEALTYAVLESQFEAAAAQLRSQQMPPEEYEKQYANLKTQMLDATRVAMSPATSAADRPPGRRGMPRSSNGQRTRQDVHDCHQTGPKWK